MVHFRTSRVSSKCGIVRFLQQVSFESYCIWYTESIPIPQHFILDGKLLILSFVHTFPYFHKFRVVILLLLDLIDQ